MPALFHVFHYEVQRTARISVEGFCMKINFDTEYRTASPAFGDRIQNDNKISNSPKGFMDTAAAGGVMMSQGIMGDMPFADSGKEPVTDLAAGLSATDVQLKTDYMSVMSLSMSDEDYSELVRTGQMPEDMDVTDSVTILDEIKAALIKGGADVAGFTDTVDDKVLAELLHGQDLNVSSEVVTQVKDAVSMAMEVLPINDTAAAYLVENSKSPTVENIYQASHAGVAEAKGGRRYFSEDGYINMGGVQSDSSDIEALRPQIEETIRKAGLEVDDRNYEDAKLLINYNIPLTPETLLSLESIRDLREEPDPNKLAASVSIALSAGIPGQKANLTYEESVYTQAEELTELVRSIPDEAADAVVGEGLLLNLRNLTKAAEDLQAAPQTQAPVIDTESMTREQIHARRVLEEARITMSVEANRLLLRSNYRIDIAPMEELVDALKEAEAALAHRLFPSDDEEVSSSRMKMYTDVKSELGSIPSMPAAILGQYNGSGRLQFGMSESFTLHEVYESGSVRREAYIRAEETYEALMTAPRRDMGDSITKAFRNVDDILEDLNMEQNDLNRRAVRILGYNSIEITVEKIEEVRTADIGLRDVLNRLTPERVLNMIREDVNPLNMPIQELGDYLNRQDGEPERQAADFARFLMQLERQNEITDLERDSYIGIYRMLAGLDRTDDAAVGKLMEMGLEMSFANLLAAMRSTAKSGMDYSVGDDFGGVDSIRSNARIDEQISAAFTTGRFAESARANESIIENLLMSGEGVSLTGIEAINALKHKRGDWLAPITDKILRSKAGNDAPAPLSADDLSDRVDDLLEHMTGADEAVSAYTSMLDEFKEDLADMTLEADSYLDVRAIRTSMKQLNILSSLARDEVYDIPADIDGEYTSIRLTIRHESGAGRVAVTMMTESIGVIASEFSFRGEMSGIIAYEQESAFDRLSQMTENLSEKLRFKPELVHTAHIDPDNFTDSFFDRKKSGNEIKDGADTADINNIELYRVARVFISALRAI